MTSTAPSKEEEFSDGLAKYSPALFVVWLMIASAYMPELAGCQFRRLLGTSMVAKHIIGVIMVYFSVIVINPDYSSDKGGIHNILISLGIYFWFVLTTRCDWYITLIVIGLMFAVYTADKYRDSSDKTATKKNLSVLMQRLTIIAIAITLLGVVMYMLRKMDKFGNDFSYWYFFVGRIQCESLKEGSTEVLEEID